MPLSRKMCIRDSLREKDVLDITAVQYAILETDGNLSVFPFQMCIRDSP